jgi:hypothetical protein
MGGDFLRDSLLLATASVPSAHGEVARGTGGAGQLLLGGYRVDTERQDRQPLNRRSRCLPWTSPRQASAAAGQGEERVSARGGGKTGGGRGTKWQTFDHGMAMKHRVLRMVIENFLVDRKGCRVGRELLFRTFPPRLF